MRFLVIGCLVLIFSSCGKSVINRNCCVDPPLAYIENNVVTLMPSLFTPNADGNNDTFGPIVNFGVTSYDLKVVDTKRTLHEASASIQSGIESGYWDGRFEGETKEGIFGWELTIVTFNEDTVDFRGQVCVLADPSDFCIQNENRCVTSEQYDGTTFDLNRSTGEMLCL